MPIKKRYAAVFVHGLAKKPAPPKLEEIWLWGLGRDNPKGDVFPNPNPGIDLAVEGVLFFFNYYAGVLADARRDTPTGGRCRLPQSHTLILDNGSEFRRRWGAR